MRLGGAGKDRGAAGEVHDGGGSPVRAMQGAEAAVNRYPGNPNCESRPQRLLQPHVDLDRARRHRQDLRRRRPQRPGTKLLEVRRRGQAHARRKRNTELN